MIKSLITICIGGLVTFLSFSIKLESEESVELPYSTPVTSQSAPCLRMFNSIEKYSRMYNIPRDYAYGIAYAETRYEGPFHWKYKHTQTSSAGALGPMQLMYPTAKGLFPKKKFSREELMENIDFNVHCSMKLLRNMYDRYGDWKIVFGCYNTGRPMINDYAVNVYNFKLR
jgi:soluble lytic murein transglycosylase-like protein